MGYMAWAGSLPVAQARAEDRNPSIFIQNNPASSSFTPNPTPSPTATPEDRRTRTPRFRVTPTPKATKTPSPSPTPSQTPSPSPNPTPNPTPRKSVSELAASIANFFKGGSGSPPASGRGLNILSANPEASPYQTANNPKLWYVLAGGLALLGASTFVYGRSKHS